MYAPSQTLHGVSRVNPDFLKAQRGQPLTLHATFYCLVFGNARDAAIIAAPKAPQKHGRTAMLRRLFQLECSAPFRWSAEIVSQKSSGGGKSALTRLISFSPIPANLQLDLLARKVLNFYLRDPYPKNDR